MDQNKKDELLKLINQSLNNAEAIWNKEGANLVAMDESAGLESYSINKSESTPSFIPGYPMVSSDQNEVATFIALVADMRESSKHLLCDISSKKAKVSMLQRVYYETSALLPALAKTIDYEQGAVTEYLGDGVLAFFKVDDNNESESIYAAHRAAKNCINICRAIVNEEIEKRYNLPPLDIGIGLACSKALITLVGLEGSKHAKAFGECVFRATKLSGGMNCIYTDARLEAMWPTVSGGGLRFNRKEVNGVEGYLIE
ncbi:adenylate/guanylate cyclase [Motilimonas pumila]|uniref:Adenylate/guanylate cyclase n=1 Tax=Motilimonas pumila TaxID=2303987 RepID=A0A418Y945_9GAMM|nr:adenylate/guanylate cyclase [Motilimonas pumila]RJG36227.1 adenylate/guanylate cyclase [Motilimonas pumila]